MMKKTRTDSPTSDIEYERVEAYMHLGQWAEAMRLLEPLAARYPERTDLARLLDEARFKAGLDRGSQVRAKRWAFSWRPWATRLAFIFTLALLVWFGTFIVRSRIIPLLADSQERQARALVLADATACLEAGNLACTEEKIATLRSLGSDDPRVAALAKRLAEERTLVTLYEEATALTQAGRCEEALPALSELQLRRSDYRDVSDQVAACAHDIDVMQVLEDADGYYALGIYDSALELYEQVRALDVSYQSEYVAQQMVDLHLRMAREILGQTEASLDDVRTALDHLRQALQLQPRNTEVALERDIAQNYLNGQAAHAQRQWAIAVGALQSVYQERPEFLGGVVPPLLYDAYIGHGDRNREDGDCTMAYELYRQAAGLPVSDTAAATARLEQVTACLTPTPTVTPTIPPTATPRPGPSATPTAVPPPLRQFRNRIVFKSEKEDQPGFWAMDATGENRQYIGDLNDKGLREQFQQLLVEYRQGTDGKSYVYVDDVDGRPQIVLSHSEGAWPTRPLTRLTGMAYDPAWAPDGSQVLFVTQENESDDIWVIRPDSSGQRALMRNDWEWDKHPSWSPDSTRIVFWSNRWGAKQIFIMDANGQRVRNISNVPWDEYDPIWIR